MILKAGTAGDPVHVVGAPAGQASIPDGDDIAEGATTDAAATAGGTGSVSAKLRTLTAQVGATNGAAQTDPTQTATMIQLLKGIVSLLQDIKTNTA